MVEKQSFADQYEAHLDGHTKWPCIRPGCDNKIDPDGPSNYCSKTCQNAVYTKSSGISEYRKVVQRMRADREWYDAAIRCGFVTRPDAPFTARSLQVAMPR